MKLWSLLFLEGKDRNVVNLKINLCLCFKEGSGLSLAKYSNRGPSLNTQNYFVLLSVLLINTSLSCLSVSYNFIFNTIKGNLAMKFYAWEHFMLAIFRRMVCLIKCTILDISPGYFQTKCVTLIGIMVHEVTIFRERQTMASVK